VAKEHDLDITYQRARQFGVVDFGLLDIIYVMDKQNYQKVSEMAPTEEALDKVSLIMNELTPGKDQDVPVIHFTME
jgi:protein-tyrosine phosphatase